MPNKLTDNEIKKALEICGTYKGKCTDCPAFIKVDRSNCKKVLLGALDIINRYEEKNSNLTSDLTSLQNDLTSAKAENERLNAKLKSVYKELERIALMTVETDRKEMEGEDK